MPTDAELVAHVKALAAELDTRGTRFRELEEYVKPGGCPVPRVVQQAQVTKAYRLLMEFAQTNYAPLIVRAARARLAVGGIRSEDPALDAATWAAWQANRMDASSRLAHDCALTHGRVFAIIWPGETAPSITIEDPSTVIVEYREGSQFERVAALRRWVDAAGVPYATLYRPDGVYKFVGPKNTLGSDVKWERRLVDGETWPLLNPVPGDLPVVEIATNLRLAQGRGRYGYAAGDFENVLGLLDRINVLEFLRLVIAFTQGFPIRAVVGDKIVTDDDGNPIAPFKLAADVIAQFENPDVKITEIQAADLKAFGDAIDHDVETLAGITMTPTYYLHSLPIQNVSADAIRASDAPLNARVLDHQEFLGEGHEDVLRVTSRLISETPLSASAEVMWVNRESRSLAERADAAIKLQQAGMPWQAVAEYALDVSQAEIARWQSMRSADVLGGLLNQGDNAVAAG